MNSTRSWQNSRNRYIHERLAEAILQSTTQNACGPDGVLVRNGAPNILLLGVSQEIVMNDKQKEFLKKMADLMKEYNVTMDYTADDDGIHLYMDSNEFHVSDMDDPEKLRAESDA